MRAVPDTDLSEYRRDRGRAASAGAGDARRHRPTIVDAQECVALIAARIDDWGGCHHDPRPRQSKRPWPNLDKARRHHRRQRGHAATERLTAQPPMRWPGSPWIDPRVAGHVRASPIR